MERIGFAALVGRRLAERGVTLVDAPVSGGSEGAREGTLRMFVGGDENPDGPIAEGHGDEDPSVLARAILELAAG